MYKNNFVNMHVQLMAGNLKNQITYNKPDAEYSTMLLVKIDKLHLCINGIDSLHCNHSSSTASQTVF